jgi:hypothetical protein
VVAELVGFEGVIDAGAGDGGEVATEAVEEAGEAVFDEGAAALGVVVHAAEDLAADVALVEKAEGGGGEGVLPGGMSSAKRKSAYRR